MSSRRESNISDGVDPATVEDHFENTGPTITFASVAEEDGASETRQRPDTFAWRLPFGNAENTHHLPQATRDSPRKFSAIRRMSTAIADTAARVDPLAPVGNPLHIGINDTRRISSAGFQPRGLSFARAASSPVSNLAPIPQRPGSERSEDSEGTLAEKQIYQDGEDYVIKRLAKFDDIETMPGWKRILHRLSPILVLASIVAYWLYFGLRVHLTILAENKANTVYGMAWAFILVELFIALPMMLHRFWCLHATGIRRRPKMRLIGDNVPSVDVIITCCKEDDNLVLDTALGACNIDYPEDRFRVMICDDGRSAGLKAMVEKAALVRGNLHYRSRPKFPGVPHHFKAGNLNDALATTALFPAGAADFFAALDADMIPERDWLRALLPHMLQNPNCAMACPPQLFYNIPVDDPLCQSLDVFAHISEPVKDSVGTAWCTGSGYIVRRKALMAVGGFPIGSLAEDVCCSSMLLGAGSDTVYVHEPLQFGTVPDALDSHLKQRTRWTIGTIQTSFKLRFSLYGPLVRHMSFIQRVCGFVYTIGGLFTIFLCITMITAPIVLISGGDMIPFNTTNQLRWLMRACFLSMALNRMSEVMAFLPCGYHIGQRDLRAMMWMAPFHTISVIQTFCIPKFLGGKVAVFTSTGSQKAELNERDVRLRAPLWRRLKVTLWDCKVWMHLVYVLFVIAAVTVATWRNFHNPARNGEEKLTRFLTHAGWPPLIWITSSISCCIPIKYAILPPTVPDREELLDRDLKTGVAYPTAWARDSAKSSWMTWVHEAQYSGLMVYTTLVFAWSFFIKDAAP